MENINIKDSATTAIGKINRNFDLCDNNADLQTLFLGKMVQNGNWVSQKDVLKPVNYAITYTFTLPNDVVAKVEYGIYNGLGSTSANLFSGQSFTLLETTEATRISFARYNGAVTKLELADALEMMADGSIVVNYDDKDVIAHNIAKECELKALQKLTYRQSADTSSEFYYKKAPLIAHISDTHGDAQRVMRMCEYAKHYGIDICVATGDMVMTKYDDGSDYAFEASKKVGIDMLFAIGNHEVQYTNSIVNFPSAMQNAGVNFTNHLADYAEENGLYKEANVVTDRGYYYHDIADKLIRIIALDQFDGGVYSPNDSAVNLGGRISQAQIDWFIATLKNTPANYGIVVAMHSPENAINAPSGNDKFYTTCPTSGNGNDHYNYAPNGMYADSSRPISKIIDAFISKGSYSGGWTGTYKGESETISFTADFSSGVNEGVEFVCYLNGHIHQDRVGYLAGTTNPQLNLNIISGIGLAGTPDDLPKNGTGVTQDSFNVYAIDRANKQVRILRIGSNVKKDFSLRDWLIIDYA